MKNKIVFCATLLPLAMCAAAFAKILHVPANYSSIQAAVNAAAHGDTVLVAPGTYYENIIFRGKRITVASHYLLNNEARFIRSTIINGSRPAQPDTASCVLLINREDSTAVLAGFTLTGGKGTRWLDEHGAGFYWEGGGVLTALSSPTIRDNFIVHNEAINTSRAVSAGGGGIRSGDGAPRLLNNVILANHAMYGGGIVLNYCGGALVRNNLIAENRVDQAVAGAQTFGGGGIWVNNFLAGARSANRIENNTIVGNSSSGLQNTAVAGQGGAFVFWNNALVSARNNIVWANTQERGTHIFATGATLNLTYSAIEGGYEGEGNLGAHPAFADSGFYLSAASPCIDAGDPSVNDNDVESAGSGQALWPSRGALRNDMGAYGGPGAHAAPSFSRANLSLARMSFDFGNILPGQSGAIFISLKNVGAAKLVVNEARILANAATVAILTSLPLRVSPASADSLALRWTPAENGILSDTLLLFSNDTTKENPQRLVLNGNANPTPVLHINTALLNLGDIDINLARVDTSFWIHNIGTGADSIFTAIDYRGVRPATAVMLAPSAASLAAGDSLLVTFSLFPRTFMPPILSVYSPRLLIDSKFSLGTKRFEKNTRFRLVGTLAVDDGDGEAPESFHLEQNYPNPFSAQGNFGPHGTRLRFHLPRAERVQLRIYDELGRMVATIIDAHVSAGTQEVALGSNELSAGIYHLVLRAGKYEAKKKMTVLR